jgi:hypothetical protein
MPDRSNCTSARRPLTVDGSRSGHVYQSRQQLVFGWVGAVVTTGTGIGVLLLPHAGRHGGYVVAAAAFLAAVGMVRFARCGVRITPDGVRVTNIFNRKDLVWEQIQEFKLSPVGACQISLQDGTWVSITGLEQTNLEWLTNRRRTPTRRTIDELNELLRDHSAAA